MSTTYFFEDRVEAGRHLAGRLGDYRGRSDVTVLGLPRGGVPVGYEVARALSAPLDVLLVRKLGVPGQEELAMGAIASGGLTVINRQLVRQLAIPQEAIRRVAAAERRELDRREALYRGSRPPPALAGRAVILVDDGLATGASMRAAARVVRQARPARIVVAVPVAAQQTCEALRDEVDEVVCGVTPEPFLAVGYWYGDFSQTSDEEVRALLDETADRAAAASAARAAALDSGAAPAPGQVPPRAAAAAAPRAAAAAPDAGAAPAAGAAVARAATGGAGR